MLLIAIDDPGSITVKGLDSKINDSRLGICSNIS